MLDLFPETIEDLLAADATEYRPVRRAAPHTSVSWPVAGRPYASGTVLATRPAPRRSVSGASEGEARSGQGSEVVRTEHCAHREVLVAGSPLALA